MNVIKLCKKYYNKYREVIVYLVTGAITTLVNFVVFFVLTNLLDVHYIVSNIIAWAAAVVSAFLMNKLIVFNDGDLSVATIFKQAVSFAGFRVASGAMETLLLWLPVEFLGINENIVKIVVSVFVVVVNYVFSKLVIFRKKK